LFRQCDIRESSIESARICPPSSGPRSSKMRLNPLGGGIGTAISLVSRRPQRKMTKPSNPNCLSTPTLRLSVSASKIRPAEARASSDHPLNPSDDIRLRSSAQQSVHFPAPFEQEQRRYALNAEPRRGGWVFIHIEFRHPDAAGHLDRQLFQHRRDGSARPAPRRPHIHQHRQRGPLHAGRKSGIGYSLRFAPDDERRLAPAAHRLKPLLQLCHRYTIRRATRIALDQLRFGHILKFPLRSGCLAPVVPYRCNYVSIEDVSGELIQIDHGRPNLNVGHGGGDTA